MPTMILSPASASNERISNANASDARLSAGVELAQCEAGLSGKPAGVPMSTLDMPGAAQSAEYRQAMGEEDTVCVLEVLAEMQRIIDRHLEKTEQAQPKG